MIPFTLAERINKEVNARVKGVPEGRVRDVWRLPTDNTGDCEDYALEKRRMLLEAGHTIDELGMAVCHTGFEAHAVLLVQTDKGEFVLDNLRDQLLTREQTGYSWEKRQVGSRWQLY